MPLVPRLQSSLVESALLIPLACRHRSSSDEYVMLVRKSRQPDQAACTETTSGIWDTCEAKSIYPSAQGARTRGLGFFKMSRVPAIS